MTDSAPRSERFTQTNGRGVLELRGGDLEIGLWVGGAPLVFDAADGGPSLGRFTILLDGKPRPEIDAQIAREAAQGFTDAKSLAEALRPLLDLMPNGEYELSLQTLRYGASDYQVTDWDAHQKFSRGRRASIYPYDLVLIFTQPYDSLDEETILNYAAAIEAGQQPTAIVWTARDQTTHFVLDGHHKFAAYWLLQRDTPMLLIESELTQPVSFAQARGLVPESAQPNYLRDKEWTEKNLLSKIKDRFDW